MIYAEIAHWMGLVPLAWLAWLLWRHEDPDLAFWVLACAFSVSWAADTVAHWVNPWVLSVAFPVAQTALVGAALLPRKVAVGLVVMLVMVAAIVILMRGAWGPDVMLSTVASGSVVAIVWRWRSLGRLRLALLIYFGLGQVAWIVHSAWLIVPTWFPYQLCRLGGLLLFCRAVTEPVQLSLLRGPHGYDHRRSSRPVADRHGFHGHSRRSSVLR